MIGYLICFIAIRKKKIGKYDVHNIGPMVPNQYVSIGLCIFLIDGKICLNYIGPMLGKQDYNDRSHNNAKSGKTAKPFIGPLSVFYSTLIFTKCIGKKNWPNVGKMLILSAR